MMTEKIDVTFSYITDNSNSADLVKCFIPVLVLFSFLYAQVDTVWTARYDGPLSDVDRSCGVALDSSGNIIVTGASIGINTWEDYATIKYDPSGEALWLRRYDGPWNGSDLPVGVVIDNSNNIYVSGTSLGFDATYDYLTIKYNSDGDTLWVRTLNGPWSDHDYVSDFLVDGDGTMIITGTTREAWENTNFMTVKYNSQGDAQWVYTYNHFADKNDSAVAIVQDAIGNIYVTGTSWDYLTGYDYATLKYDSLGQELWVARYNGLSDSSDIVRAIVCDNNNNIYVTGKCWTSGSGYDIVTIKYNADGDTLWSRTYNGSGNSNDEPSCLLWQNDHLYVIGSTRESNMDYNVIKYDTDGNEQWTTYYDAGGTDIACAAIVDDSNSVYVTGASFGFGTLYDYATVKFNEAGAFCWAVRYAGETSISQDKAYAIDVDNQGSIVVTGESGYGTAVDFATIKYSQNTDLSEYHNQPVSKYSITPTPFRNAVMLNLPAHTNAHIFIYDCSGVLVQELKCKGSTQWNPQASLPAGVYFVHIEMPEQDIIKKVVKLK